MASTLTRAPGLTRAQRRELEAELRLELARFERSMTRAASRAEDTPADGADARVHDGGMEERTEVTAALAGRAALRHAAIIEALERMNNGSYGRCVSCQQPIPYGRLMVMPEAAYCMACGGRA
ncbi:MAG TPA: TraR/DksA C4-type zinc finger protein [Gemmatimonadaceae bacterium]|nr:TraR/DksA C4-type zinc finger protein [Gemmatimonadaceae bacterium]